MRKTFLSMTMEEEPPSLWHSLRFHLVTPMTSIKCRLSPTAFCKVHQYGHLRSALHVVVVVVVMIIWEVHNLRLVHVSTKRFARAVSVYTNVGMASYGTEW